MIVATTLLIRSSAIRNHHEPNYQHDVSDRILDATKQYNPSEKRLPADEIKNALTHYTHKLFSQFDIRYRLDPNAYLPAEEMDNRSLSEMKKSNYLAYWIIQLSKTTFAQSVYHTYQKLTHTANVYWWTWLTGVIITGLTATFAPPFFKIMTLIAIGTITLASISAAIARNLRQTKAEPRNERERKVCSETYLRFYIKSENDAYQKKMISILGQLNITNHEKLTLFPKLYYKRYLPIRSIKSLLGKEPDDHFNAYLARKKTYSLNKIVLDSINTMINHITVMMFILSLITTTLVSLSYLPILSLPFGVLANVFINPEFTIKLVTLTVSMTGILTFADGIKQLMFFNLKSDHVGNALYKPEKLDPITTTKREAFNILEERVQQLKNIIRDIKTNLSSTISDNKNPIDQFILNYDADNIDVTNDYLFRKMKHEPSFFSLIKKTTTRLIEFFNGSQRWIVNVYKVANYGGSIVSTLSGIGICFLGATYGPIAAFLACATLLGLTGGIFKYQSYELKRNAENKIEFLDHIDARLSYLSKKHVQLDYLIKLYHITHPDDAIIRSYHSHQSLKPRMRVPQRVLNNISITQTGLFKPVQSKPRLSPHSGVEIRRLMNK